MKEEVGKEGLKDMCAAAIVLVESLQLLPGRYIRHVSRQNFVEAVGQQPAYAAAADEIRQYVALEQRQG